ncbi:MAG: hypothetical protein L0Z50_09245 [Verrucomicrobiales bacterium]|nr:hypothetical protein [Verrucomicrobiales bacterium]
MLEDGGTPLSSRVETDFDTFGNLLEVREFDFSNNLVRKTTNTYAVIGLIRDRVTSTTVRDAVGNVKAKTEVFYDEPGYINVECPPNVPQHDDTTHGCSATARGNPTTIRRWVNGSQYVHNSPKYDSLGNVLSVTDTALHITTFDYADSWSGPCAVAAGARAFPKKVTNHLGHATTFTYNNCTGAVVSATDPNNQTTSIAYDWAGRPVQTNRPDGGQTLWHYEDTSRYIRMKTLRALGAYVVNYSYFDTLGRLFREDLCEDGADQCTSPVKAEITYDALGRPATVTNPFRSTSDPTYGITTHKYDALHRITRIIPPDGNEAQDTNVVKYAYSGNAHTITDQAGKQRRSFTDALGRLIQVDEPNPTLSTPAVTTYTYDTLDNLLTSVQSGSRQRTFTYDWLSRLLTASHPESGATTYTYQGSGTDSLLQSVTDARSITTTHAYDALHRLTQKSYSNGDPPANYHYDWSLWGYPVQNPTGRLVQAWTSNDGTANMQILGYDAVGRIVQQWDCRLSQCPNYTGAAYDLAGNPTSLTYPSGRKVTYAYDTASRLNQVRFDSFNGTPVGYNYVSSATYHPHGAPNSLTLGNSLAETMVYNSRVQPCRMNLKSGGTVTLTCTDGAPSGNLADFKYGFNHGTANNGSVISWIGQGAGITDFNRSYTYDELNRLKTMTGAGGACTGLEWIYDIWGNRDEQRVASGTCPTHNPTILTNNRIAELSYDAAGHVTADGSFTYQWDAESRLKSLSTTGAIYTYDAAGMRVRKAVGSNSTEYIYFNGQVIAERSASGNWTDYVYAGSRLVARSDPVVVRFTNDSCSACGGPPVGGGDRNLFVNSVTVGSTTILPNDPSVAYTVTPCNGYYSGVGTLACSGDMISSSVAAGGSITVNAYGSPDYSIYPHMQLWVNGILVGEWDVTGTAQNYTVASTIPGVQYYHGDRLGSTRVVTNGNGEVLWSYDYAPFGEGATADNLVNRLFTGHERDAESGLDHTWFRKYSSAQGRWLSPDPLAGSITDPQSLNRYAYVLNNPVNLVDPLGLTHDCVTVFDTETEQPLATFCSLHGNAWCTEIYIDQGYAGNTCNFDRLGNEFRHLDEKVKALIEKLRNVRPPQAPPEKKPANCSVIATVIQSTEISFKVGLELKISKLFEGGFSLYKNLVTGETGGEGGITVLTFGASAKRVTPDGGAINSGGPPEFIVTGAFFEKNLSTGTTQFSPSKQILRFGAAVGAGFELSLNPDKFSALAENCRFTTP